MKKISLLLAIIVLDSLMLYSQAEPDTLAQYLFPAFHKNTVLLKNGTSYSLLLNYNKVTEKMVFMQKGSYFDLANLSTVDTVFLNGRKFIPNESYFLELLVSGSSAFFIRNKGELIAPPRPAGYGTTTQLTSSNLLSGISTPQGYYNFRLPEGYTVKPASSYWVKKENTLSRFGNESQLIKIFPGRESEIKNFIKTNRLRFIRQQDVVRIAEFCSRL